MRLYHGTSSKHLDDILENGIRPRGRRKGNWKEFPSRKDMVYLTNAYAPFFALHGSALGEKALILELDSGKIDEGNLYPDEDFIAQAIAQQKGCGIEDVHDEVRDNLELYRHHAMLSLEHLGNCSHKGRIPSQAVSRYCLVDCSKRTDLGIMSMDPSISLMNYRFCGEKYRSVISWLFGDRKDFLLGVGGNEVYIELVERCQPGYRKIVEDLFGNREGIEVVEVAA